MAYKEDTDHVSSVLRDVGSEIETDPDFRSQILAPLEILGVNEFGDSAVIIKIRIKTRPIKQWMIGRELRRRIKKAFDAEGIEIPFPHMSLYVGEASKSFLTQQIELDSLVQSDARKTDAIVPTARQIRPTVGKADTEADTDGGYE